MRIEAQVLAGSISLRLALRLVARLRSLSRLSFIARSCIGHDLSLVIMGRHAFDSSSSVSARIHSTASWLRTASLVIAVQTCLTLWSELLLWLRSLTLVVLRLGKHLCVPGYQAKSMPAFLRTRSNTGLAT